MSGPPDSPGTLTTAVPVPFVAQPPREANEWWLLRRMSWETLRRRTDDLRNPPAAAMTWFDRLVGVAVGALLGFITILTTVSSWEDRHAPALVLFGCVALAAAAGALIVRTVGNEGADDFAEQKRCLIRELDEMEKHFKEVPTEAGGDFGTPTVIASPPRKKMIDQGIATK